MPMSVRFLPRPKRSLSSATCTVAAARSTTLCAQLMWCLAGSAGHGDFFRCVTDIRPSWCRVPSRTVVVCLWTTLGSSACGWPCSSACRWPVVVYGWPVAVYGWLVVVYGWPVAVHGRPLVPKTCRLRMSCGRLRMACGRLRTTRGRLRTAHGSQNGSSADGPWSSADGPWSSADDPTGARMWLLFVVQPRCNTGLLSCPLLCNDRYHRAKACGDSSVADLGQLC